MNQLNLHFAPAEYQKLLVAASDLGFSPNQLAKSWVLITLNSVDSQKTLIGAGPSLAALQMIMMKELHALPSGKTFIVSALFVDVAVWASLDTSSKMNIAGALKKYVVANPLLYECIGKKNNINVYKKL